MVEHDRGLREGAGQIDDIAELGVKQPGIEAESQRGEAGETLAEIAVAIKVLGCSRAIDREARVGMPGGPVADALEAAAGDCDVLLEDALGSAADPEIDIADDPGNAAR